MDDKERKDLMRLQALVIKIHKISDLSHDPKVREIRKLTSEYLRNRNSRV